MDWRGFDYASYIRYGGELMILYTALAEQAAVSQAPKARGLSIVNTENQSVGAR